MKKILHASVVLGLLASGCDAEAPEADLNEGAPHGAADGLGDQGDEGQVLPLDFGESTDGFRVEIQSMAIDGDHLTVDIGHFEGCGTHDYRLLWDGDVVPGDSPHVQLHLRDMTDDFCDAPMARSVTFDVSMLRIVFHPDAVQGAIQLSVDDVEGPLYSWSVPIPALTIGEPPEGSQGTTIRSVRAEDDVLVIDVRYGGGCAEHTFDLFWDGLTLDGTPPRAVAKLFHGGDRDICESVIHKTLRFEASELSGHMITVEDASGLVNPFVEDVDHAACIGLDHPLCAD